MAKLTKKQWKQVRALLSDPEWRAKSRAEIENELRSAAEHARNCTESCLTTSGRKTPAIRLNSGSDIIPSKKG